MDSIKVNEKTHEMLVQIDSGMKSLQAQLKTIAIAIGVPIGYGYNIELKQFEPPKESNV
jgi:hypothetical protein